MLLTSYGPQSINAI